jgi:hypothetical protein
LSIIAGSITKFGFNIFIARIDTKNVGIRAISSYHVLFGLAIILGLVSAFAIPALSLNSSPSIEHDSDSHDNNNNIAEASLLPLLVDDYDKTYVMFNDGKAGLVTISSNTVDPENHCEFCLRIDYTPGVDGKAGVAIAPKSALNLVGADRVVVFAKSNFGGDTVKFFAAGKKSSGSLGDLSTSATWAAVSEEITLLSQWRKFEIDISQGSLTSIDYLLGIELPKNPDRTQITIYLQGVTIDGIDPEKPIPLEDVVLSAVPSSS